MEYSVSLHGGHRFENGSIFVGNWNNLGEKEGEGHLLMPDGTRYDGFFHRNLFNGYGVLQYADGAKYEGEFRDGWFHGSGVFWRCDGMRHEGEFRGGKVHGLGITTFSDQSHGFPRNEGFFQDCVLKTNRRCPEIVQKAQKIAFMARQRFT